MSESATSDGSTSEFLFLLTSNEPFTAARGSALATCELGLSRGLQRRGHRTATVAPSSTDDPYVGETLYMYASADTSAGLHRMLLRAVRKVRGGTEHELERGIRTALKRGGCPAVALAINSALGFGALKRRCPGARTVLWLQNVCGVDDVPGLGEFGTPDLVAANSAFTALASASLLNLPADAVKPLLNAVDPEQFHPRPDYLDQRHGPMRILLLGRIDPNKGYDRALSGIRLARDAGVETSVVLAGPPVSWSGDPQAYLAQLRAQLDTVAGDYVGHVTRDRLPGFIREFDVMIVPSLADEPFGLVVLEGMASGLAVISSNRGGLPEACGGAGFLIDPDDPEAIAEAIGKLNQKEALHDAKRRAVVRARQRSWQHATADLLDLLDMSG